MCHDLRLAWRFVRRTPGVAIACAVTLAVDTGEATAVVQLLNGVVLKPLPVDQPHDLVLFSDDASGLVLTGLTSRK